MHMQLIPYLVHYIEEAIQEFYVFEVDWRLLACSKEKKKNFKVDYFPTHPLSCWGSGRLVAYKMLICYGIVLSIKMHYKIFSPFNEEGQMMFLGPEVHSWTAWVLYVSDGMLLQAWEFNAFCISWPSHYPLGRGNQLRSSKLLQCVFWWLLVWAGLELMTWVWDVICYLWLSTLLCSNRGKLFAHLCFIVDYLNSPLTLPHTLLTYMGFWKMTKTGFCQISLVPFVEILSSLL